MKKISKARNFSVCAGLFCLLMGFNSCSKDDDDADQAEAYGKIIIDESAAMEGKTLVIPAITVKQISWLAAVEVGDENTNNFIAQPVKVSLGTNWNVRLTFDENFHTDYVNGHPVVLKLYADNPSYGIKGAWDDADQPIGNANNPGAMLNTTIFIPVPEPYTFSWYDKNNDNVLDKEEAAVTYYFYYFSYDTNGDGFLSKEEFYYSFFYNIDIYFSNTISEEEWTTAYEKLLGHHTEANFFSVD